jgi:hypothetical protein
MSTIQLRVPAWADFLCVWPVLVYRLVRRGCVYRRIWLGDGLFVILDLR